MGNTIRPIHEDFSNFPDRNQFISSSPTHRLRMPTGRGPGLATGHTLGAATTLVPPRIGANSGGGIQNPNQQNLHSENRSSEGDTTSRSPIRGGPASGIIGSFGTAGNASVTNLSVSNISLPNSSSASMLVAGGDNNIIGGSDSMREDPHLQGIALNAGNLNLGPRTLSEESFHSGLSQELLDVNMLENVENSTSDIPSAATNGVASASSSGTSSFHTADGIHSSSSSASSSEIGLQANTRPTIITEPASNDSSPDIPAVQGSQSPSTQLTIRAVNGVITTTTAGDVTRRFVSRVVSPSRNNGMHGHRNRLNQMNGMNHPIRNRSLRTQFPLLSQLRHQPSSQFAPEMDDQTELNGKIRFLEETLRDLEDEFEDQLEEQKEREKLEQIVSMVTENASRNVGSGHNSMTGLASDNLNSEVAVVGDDMNGTRDHNMISDIVGIENSSSSSGNRGPNSSATANIDQENHPNSQQNQSNGEDSTNGEDFCRFQPHWFDKTTQSAFMEFLYAEYRGDLKDTNNESVVFPKGCLMEIASYLRFPATPLSNMIFVMGGRNQNGSLSSSEMFDSWSGEWVRLPPMTIARAGCAAAKLPPQLTYKNDGIGENSSIEGNNYGSVVGLQQHIGSSHKSSSVATGNNNGAMPRLNPDSLTDSTVITTLTQSNSMSYFDTIIVSGGYDSQGIIQGLQSSVEIFNPLTNTWRRSSDLCRARWGHGSATCAGRVYVVGGCGLHPGAPASENFMETLRSCELFDPESDRWYELSGPTGHLQTGRAGARLSAIGDRYLVTTGGCDDVFGRAEMLRSIEVMDVRCVADWLKSVKDALKDGNKKSTAVVELPRWDLLDVSLSVPRTTAATVALEDFQFPCTLEDVSRTESCNVSGVGSSAGSARGAGSAVGSVRGSGSPQNPIIFGGRDNVQQMDVDSDSGLSNERGISDQSLPISQTLSSIRDENSTTSLVPFQNSTSLVVTGSNCRVRTIPRQSPSNQSQNNQLQDSFPIGSSNNNNFPIGSAANFPMGSPLCPLSSSGNSLHSRQSSNRYPIGSPREDARERCWDDEHYYSSEKVILNSALVVIGGAPNLSSVEVISDIKQKIEKSLGQFLPSPTSSDGLGRDGLRIRDGSGTENGFGPRARRRRRTQPASSNASSVQRVDGRHDARHRATSNRGELRQTGHPLTTPVRNMQNSTEGNGTNGNGTGGNGTNGNGASLSYARPGPYTTLTASAGVEDRQPARFLNLTRQQVDSIVTDVMDSNADLEAEEFQMQKCDTPADDFNTPIVTRENSGTDLANVNNDDGFDSDGKINKRIFNSDEKSSAKKPGSRKSSTPLDAKKSSPQRLDMGNPQSATISNMQSGASSSNANPNGTNVNPIGNGILNHSSPADIIRNMPLDARGMERNTSDLIRQRGIRERRTRDQEIASLAQGRMGSQAILMDLPPKGGEFPALCTEKRRCVVVIGGEDGEEASRDSLCKQFRSIECLDVSGYYVHENDPNVSRSLSTGPSKKSALSRIHSALTSTDQSTTTGGSRQQSSSSYSSQACNLTENHTDTAGSPNNHIGSANPHSNPPIGIGSKPSWDSAVRMPPLTVPRTAMGVVVAHGYPGFRQKEFLLKKINALRKKMGRTPMLDLSKMSHDRDMPPKPDGRDHLDHIINGGGALDIDDGGLSLDLHGASSSVVLDSGIPVNPDHSALRVEVSSPLDDTTAGNGHANDLTFLLNALNNSGGNLMHLSQTLANHQNLRNNLANIAVTVTSPQSGVQVTVPLSNLTNASRPITLQDMLRSGFARNLGGENRNNTAGDGDNQGGATSNLPAGGGNGNESLNDHDADHLSSSASTPTIQFPGFHMTFVETPDDGRNNTRSLTVNNNPSTTSSRADRNADMNPDADHDIDMN